MPYVQQGENDLLQRRVYLHLVDATDGITAKTGQTGTCQISINGNPPTTSTNSIVEIDSTNLPGDYYVILDQKEINTLGTVLVRFKNGSTAEFVTVVDVLAFNPRLPISLQPGFNSVAGPDIDYKRIQKLIQTEIATIPQPVEPKEPDLMPIVEALHALYDEVRAIRIPDPEKLDLTPLDAKFEFLRAAIEAIKLPELDVKPVIQEIQTARDAVLAEIEEAEEEITGVITQKAEETKSTAQQLRPVYLNLTASEPKPDQPKPLKGTDLFNEYLKT